MADRHHQIKLGADELCTTPGFDRFNMAKDQFELIAKEDQQAREQLEAAKRSRSPLIEERKKSPKKE